MNAGDERRKKEKGSKEINGTSEQSQT